MLEINDHLWCIENGGTHPNPLICCFSVDGQLLQNTKFSAVSDPFPIWRHQLNERIEPIYCIRIREIS